MSNANHMLNIGTAMVSQFQDVYKSNYIFAKIS